MKKPLGAMYTTYAVGKRKPENCRPEFF